MPGMVVVRRLTTRPTTLARIQSGDESPHAHRAYVLRGVGRFLSTIATMISTNAASLSR